ncbi:hypothetical protein VNO77_27135 [Canavalia gladiata]|uniref:Uncharacterized protein n=1 Tax=Canavalia gladiata TaxID=3824 RepID=A0AAN9KU51_CANGL
MGDLLGSPRVAPPPFCTSRTESHDYLKRARRPGEGINQLIAPCLTGGPGPAAGRFAHPAAPILGFAAKAPKRAPEQIPQIVMKDVAAMNMATPPIFHLGGGGWT